jgi:hypothetical protein
VVSGWCGSSLRYNGLLHLHEDGRDHQAPSSLLRRQAAGHLRHVHGYLPQGGHQGHQQGRQRCCYPADDELGLSVRPVRLAEQGIRKVTGKEEGGKLGAWEKILASGLGGGLSAWNQPIEVIRVEMQSKTEDPESALRR